MGRPATPAIPSPAPVTRAAGIPSAKSLEVCGEGALSIEECGGFCGGLSPDEIERAIRAGEIETFHRGRRVLIARREAVRWLACLLDADRAKRGHLIT